MLLLLLPPRLLRRDEGKGGRVMALQEEGGLARGVAQQELTPSTCVPL